MELENLLIGKCVDSHGNLQIPKEIPKTVRIFLSSTFTDLSCERDHLIENIYPKLRNYCKEEYNLDFQVMDMRWGIQSEASNDHSTSNICISEIENCKNFSIGPNFIAFLSHKYGHRFLPTKLLANEFQLIEQEIKENEPEYKDLLAFEIKNEQISDLVQYCYKIDTNEILAKYRLLNIDDIIPAYNRDHKIWNEIEKRLLGILRKAAESCFRKGVFDREQLKKYFISVTEEEMFNGILKAPKESVDKNVLVFFREIEDLETSVQIDASNKQLIGRFIDLEGNKIDESAKTLREDMKASIYQKVPAANIHELRKIKWLDSVGVSKEHHKDYIQEFGDLFYESVKRLIDLNAKSHGLDKVVDKTSQLNAELITEILTHANLSIKFAKNFYGNEEQIQKIKDYLLNDSRSPLIVHAESGAGKTSLIAKIATEISKGNLIGNSPDTKVLLRFLGTTPKSSLISDVFKSLISQLALIFKFQLPDDANFKNENDARDYFMEKLEELSTTRNSKLILLFDSLDQLTVPDVDWLIVNLPANVKVIYTVITNYEKIFDQLKRLLSMDHYLGLEVLNKTTGKGIIENWLSKCARKITDKQSSLLDELLIEAEYYRQINPLYIKLIFDIFISKWKSYENIDDNVEFRETFLSLTNINKAIEYLFSVLEKTHGKVLVSRLSFYISSLRNGISENEIEDILSIDDDVLFHVFEHHHPPTRRFPQALWIRIKDDLKEYLIEKQIDDTSVIYLYHRSFIETSARLYVDSIGGSSQRDCYLTNILDFYTEKWRDEAKVFEYNEKLKKKLNKTEPPKEKRNTSMQPVEYPVKDGLFRFNRRKLTEMPIVIDQLSNNDQKEDLNLTLMTLNYEFLRGFLHSNKVSDYNSLVAKYMKNLDSKLGLYTILSIFSSLIQHPDACATLILSKILGYNRNFKYLTKFIAECDEKSYQHCSLISTFQYELPFRTFEFSCFLEKSQNPIDMIVCRQGEPRYYFILSADKVYASMGFLFTLCEIDLPPRRENCCWKHLLVFITKNDSTMMYTTTYKNQKLKDGFVVAAGLRVLAAVNFQNQICFLKEFEDEIAGLVQVSSESILVFFKECSFCEVYNVKRGQKSCELRHEFNCPIITIFSQFMNNSAINEVTYEAYRIYLFVILQNTEIHSLIVNLEARTLVPVEVLPSFGDYRVLRSHTTIKSGKNITMLPLDNGSYASFSVASGTTKDDFDLSYYYMFETSKLDTSKEIVKKFKSFECYLHDNMLTYLVLSEEQKLYLISYNRIYDICDGVYDTADLKITKSGYSYILATYNGVLDVFRFSKPFEDDKIKIVHINQYILHYDKITYFEILEDKTSEIKLYVLTASKDSRVKSTSIELNGNGKTYIKSKQKTEANQKGYFDVDNRHIGTFGRESESQHVVHIWSLNNGEAVAAVDVSSSIERIRQVMFANGILCCILETEAETEQIKCYKNKESSKFKFEQIFESRNEEKHQKSKLFYNSHHDTFLVLSIVSRAGKTIEIKTLKETECRMHETLYSNIQEHLSFNSQSSYDELLENSNFTDLDMIFVVYNNDELVLIDFLKKNVILKKNFNSISPLTFVYGQFRMFSIIETTNDILVLNRHNKLVYISLGDELKMDTIEDLECTSAIALNKHVLCSYNSETLKLAVYDLKAMSRLFEIPFNGSKSLKFSLNAEYLATLENETILSLFRISDGKRIAAVPLYYKARHMRITDRDYVALAMHDGKIISYLIVDPKKPNDKEKIQTLDSRNPDKEKLKQKIIEDLKNTVSYEYTDYELFSNDSHQSVDLNVVTNVKPVDDSVDFITAEHTEDANIEERYKDRVIELKKAMRTVEALDFAVLALNDAFEHIVSVFENHSNDNAQLKTAWLKLNKINMDTKSVDYTKHQSLLWDRVMPALINIITKKIRSKEEDDIFEQISEGLYLFNFHAKNENLEYLLREEEFLIRNCLEITRPKVTSNILSSLRRMIEIEELRVHLFRNEYVAIFRKLLADASAERVNIQFKASRILVYMISNGEEVWSKKCDAHNLEEIAAEIQKTIPTWPIDFDFKFGASDAPKYLLNPSFHSICHRWTCYLLVDITNANPQALIQLVKLEVPVLLENLLETLTDQSIISYIWMLFRNLAKSYLKSKYVSKSMEIVTHFIEKYSKYGNLANFKIAIYLLNNVVDSQVPLYTRRRFGAISVPVVVNLIRKKIELKEIDDILQYLWDHLRLILYRSFDNCEVFVNQCEGLKLYDDVSQYAETQLLANMLLALNHVCQHKTLRQLAFTKHFIALNRDCFTSKNFHVQHHSVANLILFISDGKEMWSVEDVDRDVVIKEMTDLINSWPIENKTILNQVDLTLFSKQESVGPLYNLWLMASLTTVAADTSCQCILTEKYIDAIKAFLKQNINNADKIGGKIPSYVETIMLNVVLYLARKKEFTQIMDLILPIIEDANNMPPFFVTYACDLLDGTMKWHAAPNDAILIGKKAIPLMMDSILRKLKLKQYDDIMDYYQRLLWSLTDNSPKNCELFLSARDGLYMFKNCLLTDNQKIITNVLGVMETVAFTKKTQNVLATDSFVALFCQLLANQGGESGVTRIKFFSVQILINILSIEDQGLLAWLPSDERDVLMRKLSTEIDQWAFDKNYLNLFYKLFKPFLEVLMKKGQDLVCKKFIWWVLAYFTTPVAAGTYTDGHCRILVDEKIEEIVQNYGQEDAVKRYVAIVEENIESYKNRTKPA